MLEPKDLLAGKYRIISIIGEGGYGQVYLGYDIAMDRQVAIKELLGRTAKTLPEEWQAYQLRFEKEAHVVSQFSHQNVVTAYALETDSKGNLYLILEFLAGGSLKDLLRDGPLDIERALDIALDIASAISAIYRHDIVHRDIKPSNILLDTDGSAKLTDFGVAQVGHETRRTQEATGHPGTPAYKSPEQAVSTGYLDQRSDIYALGLVLYEMLTGKAYVRNHQPPHRLNPAVPPALSHITLKALEENPIDRYQSAEAFIQDLEHVRNQATWGQLGILVRDLPVRHLTTASVIMVCLILLLGLQRISRALDTIESFADPSNMVIASPSPDLAQLLSLPENVRQPLVLMQEPPDGIALDAGQASLSTHGLSAAAQGALAQGESLEDGMPSPIAVGETQSRVFDLEGKVERLIFRVKAGHAYLVSTSNLAVGVDTHLEVLVDDRLLVNDDVAPGTLASQVSLTAVEDGTALVTVYNQDQYGTDKRYDLSVIMLDTVPTADVIESMPTMTPLPQQDYPLPLSTGSPTPRATFTLRPTWTPQADATATLALTPSPTSTVRPTNTRRPTWTPMPTWTPNQTSSPTPTNTPTATPTATSTLTTTPMPTAMPTYTPMATPTDAQLTPAPTEAPPETPVETPAGTPTMTSREPWTPTPTGKQSETVAPTGTAEPMATPTPTGTPTVTPTAEPSNLPTVRHTPLPPEPPPRSIEE